MQSRDGGLSNTPGLKFLGGQGQNKQKIVCLVVALFSALGKWGKMSLLLDYLFY